jgi:hypothetical protein
MGGEMTIARWLGIPPGQTGHRTRRYLKDNIVAHMQGRPLPHVCVAYEVAVGMPTEQVATHFMALRDELRRADPVADEIIGRALEDYYSYSRTVDGILEDPRARKSFHDVFVWPLVSFLRIAEQATRAASATGPQELVELRDHVLSLRDAWAKEFDARGPELVRRLMAARARSSS